MVIGARWFLVSALLRDESGDLTTVLAMLLDKQSVEGLLKITPLTIQSLYVLSHGRTLQQGVPLSGRKEGLCQSELSVTFPPNKHLIILESGPARCHSKNWDKGRAALSPGGELALRFFDKPSLSLVGLCYYRRP